MLKSYCALLIGVIGGPRALLFEERAPLLSFPGYSGVQSVSPASRRTGGLVSMDDVLELERILLCWACHDACRRPHSRCNIETVNAAVLS